MITIRPETPDDVAAIDEITREAFGSEVESRITRDVRDSDSFIPELSLVATKDDAVVGHVLLSQAYIQREPEHVPILALGPIAVRTDLQKQGIGALLIREGAIRAQAMGYRAIVLLGSPHYYPRFGFVPAGPLGLECRWPVPGPEFMVLELFPGALDGIQGFVVFPPAFDNV